MRVEASAVTVLVAAGIDFTARRIAAFMIRSVLAYRAGDSVTLREELLCIVLGHHGLQDLIPN